MSASVSKAFYAKSEETDDPIDMLRPSTKSTGATRTQRPRRLSSTAKAKDLKPEIVIKRVRTTSSLGEENVERQVKKVKVEKVYVTSVGVL